MSLDAGEPSQPPWDPESAGATTRSRFGKRRATAVGVVLLAALITVAVAWPVAAATARGAVVVRQDARPWICHSGTVRTVDLDNSDTQDIYASLVTVAPGMECQLRIVIDNHGSHAVTVNRVTVPFMGSASALDVDAKQLDGDISTVTPNRNSSDPEDANFTIPGGLEVSPGSTEILSVTVVYKKKATGCSLQAGSSMSGLNPTVGVTAWGIPGDVSEQSSPVGFAGASDCS